MDDLLKTLPKGVITIAVSIAALASGAAGWSYFGLFIPMSVEMHSKYHDHEQAIYDAQSALSFANKALDRAEEGTEAHNEALAYRDKAQERLDALNTS